MSLPGGLCQRTYERIIEREGLREIRASGDGDFLTLTSTMSPEPVGCMRIWTGDRVAKMVYVGLTVDAIGLDSHMVFAFGPAETGLPHFTLDSVAGQGTYAFHLDLIQRVDLSSHLAYIDHVYEPITATYESTIALDGLSKASIGPRQFSMMSPWMCAFRADEQAFRSVEESVLAYQDHWFSLLEKGLPAEVTDTFDDTDLPDRDAKNRANLFSVEVDPVWNNITRLIGDQSEALRQELLTNEIRTAP